MKTTMHMTPNPILTMVTTCLAALLLLWVLPARAETGTQTVTYVAYSLKAAQAEVKSSLESGVDFRSSQTDLYDLGGITKPVAVIVDPSSGDTIVVGERAPHLPALTLDDLAVALRCRFFQSSGADPGVTIDPQPLDSSSGPITASNLAPTQKVRFFAGIENTNFGEVCYESDYLMKRVGMGLDDLHVRGLQSYYDLLSSSSEAGGQPGEEVACRFWFLPTVDRVNVFGDVVLLEQFKMGVFTQVMSAVVDGKEVPDPDSFDNPASAAFSKSFSDHYDDAAKAAPVLEELRGVTRPAALAKGLMQADDKPNIDYWLSTYALSQVQTPTETDVLSTQNQDLGWSLCGGVQLTALAVRFKAGDAQAFKELLLKSKPSAGALSWTFDVALKEGQPISVTVPDRIADPDRTAELYAQALFLCEQGRYVDALPVYDEVTSAIPDDPDVLNNEAVAYGNLGRYKDEIKCCDNAIAANPSDASAWMHKGLALHMLNRDDEARDAWVKAAGFGSDDAKTDLAILSQGGSSASISSKQSVSDPMIDDSDGPHDPSDQTPLMSAALDGDAAGVESAISSGSDVNAKDKDGDTPLMAVAAQGLTDSVKSLLAADADPSTADKDGITALMAAAQSGRADCVTALLAAGAPANAADSDGETALMYAAESGHADCIGAIVASGAEANAADHDGTTALMYAAIDGSPSCIKALIAAGAKANAADSNGTTALMLAAYGGDPDCLHALIDGGGNANASNKDGLTALMTAAYKGDADCVDTLVAAGADVNRASKDGFTPLVIATFVGNESCVKALLKAGAKVKAPSGGLSALDAADAGSQPEIAKLLRDAGSADE